MKRLIILGCTGSIGKTALSCLEERPGLFTLVGLSAHKREAELLALGRRFHVSNLALSGQKSNSEEIIFQGERSVERLLQATDADIVLNGIAGSAGLLSSVETLKTGKDLALANKESLVMAGPLLKRLSQKVNRAILPVDSEHSALFRLLENRPQELVEEVYLTASGGALREWAPDQLHRVRPQDALKHPSWKMGPQITVDSATLANKGLEIMEARWLFDIPSQRIKVLIHPQSLVHALVRTVDGNLYAQLNLPDMRAPILDALLYPQLNKRPLASLDLVGHNLTFDTPCPKRYPMLALAREALAKGLKACIAYTIANEVAAKAFLLGQIGFPDICNVVASSLEQEEGVGSCESLEEILSVTEGVRLTAKGQLLKIRG